MTKIAELIALEATDFNIIMDNFHSIYVIVSDVKY